MQISLLSNKVLKDLIHDPIDLYSKLSYEMMAEWIKALGREFGGMVIVSSISGPCSVYLDSKKKKKELFVDISEMKTVD